MRNPSPAATIPATTSAGTNGIERFASHGVMGSRKKFISFCSGVIVSSAEV